MHWQWEPYQVPIANLEPSFGAISSVMDLHGRQKAFRESRPVDISQWRQWTCKVISCSYKLGQLNEFQFVCELVGFLLRQSHSYVNGFAKTITIAQDLKSDLLNLATFFHYQTYGYRWPSVLSLTACANPVKPWRCNTGYVEPVNGIIKDASSAKLLPMTLLTYPVDWVCFCH